MHAGIRWVDDGWMHACIEDAWMDRWIDRYMDV